VDKAEMDSRYPGLYEKLGAVPDRELAKEYGLSGPAVKKHRDAHGIPPCGGRRLPTECEWEELLRLNGPIVVSADRRSVSVGGTSARGRTLRQAVATLLRGADR
jgi:hypothetical protein